MTKITALQAIAGALLACGLSAAPAHALANRTWVSGMGTDSGACTRAAPCKTFAFALTQTNAGGEIDVLDSGDYGAVTITKAISIVNDGAGIAVVPAVAFVDGITINASRFDSINLRGLTIEGLGATGGRGIVFNSGESVVINKSTVRPHGNDGIVLAPTGSTNFFISNTLVSDAFFGINIAPQGTGTANGTIDHVVAANNTGRIGIFVSGGSATTASAVHVTIVDSVASNNGDGIYVENANVTVVNSVMANNDDFGFTFVSDSSPPTTEVMVRNSTATNNTGGAFRSLGTGILLLSRSVAVTNGYGVLVDGNSGAKVYSYGDNNINGNTNGDILAIITPLSTR